MAGLLFPEKLLAFDGLKVEFGGANVPTIEARCMRGKAAAVGESVFESSKVSENSFEPSVDINLSSGEIGAQMVGKDDAMSVVMNDTFERLTL